MKRLFITIFSVAFIGVFFLLKETKAVHSSMTIYKTATCGCCTLWGDHMKDSGFRIQAVNVENLSLIKSQYQVEPSLTSCHTAIIEGYVIEGHVPSKEVKRLLLEKPDAIGLAVAGMPIGSPGMEMDGHPGAAYDVILFRADGSHEVYASYR